VRILVVACRYHPAKNSGGPVISIDNVCTLLHDRAEFYVVALDHDVGTEKRFDDITPGWNQRENCSVYYLSNNDLKEGVLNSLITEVNPDFLYINSLFSYRFVIPALKCSRRMGLPVLLAPRGQLCQNAFKKKVRKLSYLYLFRKLFGGSMVFYQYTSDEEFHSILKYLPPPRDRLMKLSNIPNIKIKPPKKVPKIKGCLRIIFLSRIHSKKNLLGAIDFLMDVRGDVVFNIYGPKEDLSYWALCLDRISKLPMNVEVNYCGSIDYDSVFTIFSNHDVFLFPSFSENYGHVIAESLLSGCPVLISDQTPWSPVSDAGVGWAYSLDDRDGFIRTLNSLVLMDAGEYLAISNQCSDFVYGRLNLKSLDQDYYQSFCRLRDLKGGEIYV